MSANGDVTIPRKRYFWPMSPIVSIITVNYHQVALTNDLLASIHKFGAGLDLEVIVVDNGCPEDQGDLFRQVFPAVVYLRSSENLGFAGGNNLGVRYAKGKYLLFLNNDTEITDGFIQTLIDEMEHRPDIGLLSPLILYAEDRRKIQYAGFTPMNFRTGRNASLGVLETDTGQYDGLTVVTGYCHGAAMICRRRELDQVGLMEEHYFLYYEELDWCEKFRRSGFKIGFTGKARIYHKESMSVGKESVLKTYFMTRNRWLFIRRNAPRLARWTFTAYYLCIAVPFQVLRYLLRRRIDLANAAMRGVKWNLTHSINSQELGISLPGR